LWLPAECDTSLREHKWHWEPDTEDRLFSLAHLVGLYYRSVGRNCNFLLNVSPNRDGLIPELDVKRLREFGKEVRRRFPADVASTHGHGDQVELELDCTQLVNHVVIMEEISQGERILEYVVEVQTSDGSWQPVCSGECVGHKRIEQFEPVSTSSIRLRITKAKAEPRIRRLAAHFVTEEA
jgi:alpha-L-fucosidase